MTLEISTSLNHYVFYVICKFFWDCMIRNMQITYFLNMTMKCKNRRFSIFCCTLSLVAAIDMRLNMWNTMVKRKARKLKSFTRNDLCLISGLDPCSLLLHIEMTMLVINGILLRTLASQTINPSREHSNI